MKSILDAVIYIIIIIVCGLASGYLISGVPVNPIPWEEVKVFSLTAVLALIVMMLWKYAAGGKSK
jgi:hypothetical protein